MQVLEKYDAWIAQRVKLSEREAATAFGDMGVEPVRANEWEDSDDAARYLAEELRDALKAILDRKTVWVLSHIPREDEGDLPASAVFADEAEAFRQFTEDVTEHEGDSEAASQSDVEPLWTGDGWIAHHDLGCVTVLAASTFIEEVQ